MTTAVTISRVEIDAARSELPTEYVGKLEPNVLCRTWNPRRSKYCGATAGRGTDHPGVGRCRTHDGRPITTGMHSIHMHERIGPLLEEFRAQTIQEKLTIFNELDVARALLYDRLARFEEFADALLAWHASFEERRRPISSEKVFLLEAIFDEYEDCRGGKDKMTDLEYERIGEARSFVKLLGTSVEVSRPRKVLDITTMFGLLDTISKMVDRVHSQMQAGAIRRDRVLTILDEVGAAANEEVSNPAELARLQARIRAIRLR